VAIAWFLETGPRRHGAAHGGGEHAAPGGGHPEEAPHDTAGGEPADTGTPAPAEH